MKFTVKFECNYGNYPIFIHDRHAGIDWLDHVRNELGLQRFPAGRVPSLFDIFSTRNVTVEVSEEDARAIGLFRDSANVTVTVPSSSLNKFVVPSFKYKMGDDGIVHSIENYYDVDKNAILDQWWKDGYPENWIPNAG